LRYPRCKILRTNFQTSQCERARGGKKTPCEGSTFSGPCILWGRPLNHHPTLFSNRVWEECRGIAACPRWNSRWPGLTCCSIGSVSSGFTYTSVARAVGLNVNTFFIFHFLKIDAMWTHSGLNWIFLANTIFAICLNSQQQNSLQSQSLPHLRSENCEINSIKFDLLRPF
jgi:hypothetical protein